MPHDHQFPRVFISYSRYDGAATAARLRREFEALGISLWHDLTAMQGGQDWWRQIQQATDKAEYLVLVLTPGALASKVCKDEWRYARQVGTYVIPVTDLRVADLDLTQLAGWMRRSDIVPLHVPERHAWLLERLKAPAPPLARVPMMAEPPPPDFVPRPAEFARLKQLLLDTRGEPVAITAALRGAGGYGKTTLARALCADPDIQDAFHDGILWTTLGEQPGPLLGRLQDLIATLKGERPDFSTEEAAASQLAEILADRRILLVIDDLWQAAHARPFLRGGPHGARLITTRNSDTLPANAQEAKVDAMQGREAMALLRGDLPAGEDAALAALATRLGEWPLLLRLAHGALRDRTVRAKAPLADAIAYAGRLLDKRGLTAFDARNPEARSDAVAKTIGLSLDLLTAAELARFAELAAFPEDVAVPIRTVELLWSHTAGLDDLDTEALLQRLASLSLLLDLDLTASTVRLHDVIRTWLLGEAGPHLTDLDRALVEAYRRQCPTGWPSGPEHDDGYYFQWFPTHLRSADPDAWRTLLADYAWIDAKLRHAGATSLILDYAAAPDPEIRLIGDALRLSAHVIGHDPAQLAGQLVGRLRATVEPGSPLRRQPLASLNGPKLLPRWPTLTSPGGALLQTLEGHGGGVNAVAVTPDGRRAVSGSSDNTLKVWDLERGAALATLEGHGGGVNAVAVTPDGRRAVSGSSDNTLKVWDLERGAALATLEGHGGGVLAVAVTPDGRRAVSGSDDNTLKVWDLERGAELATLEGDGGGVNAVAVTPDGRRAVSGSSDNTLKVWDLERGAELATLEGHGGWVRAVAVTPDGRRAVSGSSDKTLKVWDLERGAELATLEGDGGEVRAVAVTPDGRRAVSGSDKTLKVWDLERETVLATFTADHAIHAVACVSDRLLVAGDAGGRVHLLELVLPEDRLL